MAACACLAGRRGIATVWLCSLVAPAHQLPVCCCGTVQALGVAIKLTFQGQNQLAYLQFYVFLGVRVACACGSHAS
jgi:hypothetical protein